MVRVTTKALAKTTRQKTSFERTSFFKGPLLRNPTVQVMLAVWLLFGLLSATDRFSPGFYLEYPAMPITMIFGSLIAGATSEGGGAVAFPVMTLILGISPHVARDFSLMIQAVGMLAAAYTIIRLRIKIVPQVIVWGSLGGLIGVCLGISWIGPRLDPAFLKLFFVSLWLSFGAALYWANCVISRPVQDKIGRLNSRKIVLFLTAGILGGCISGMVGSGLDIVIFSILTLSCRIDEKIATPTSVVLMGVNAGFGFLWRLLGSTQSWLGAVGAIALPPIAADTWNYWYVCIAVVVVGAPMGARLITNMRRMSVVYFLLASIAVQFISALFIVPWQALGLGWVIAVSFIGGCFLFGLLSLPSRRSVFSMSGKRARREAAPK
ncbi:MAG: sulfite exporter TauE/SafE family protein [Phormidesmis sp.]